ncbi:MAG: precorrin-6A/cobalt-precorrin-6A reductase [Butyricicoccaceae bacterium]
MNAALIRQTGAEILVTKDTGATGGFAEKLAAARETGIKTLIIARPREESGRSRCRNAGVHCAKSSVLRRKEGRRRRCAFRCSCRSRADGARCSAQEKSPARRAAVLRRFGACVTVTAPENARKSR